MPHPVRSLTVMAPETASCCEACATERPPREIGAATAELIVLEPDRGRSVARAGDRRITVAGLAVSAGFLAAAVAAMTLSEPVRRGLWLPVHLALAGAAGTAVASVLPFFVAALAVAVPMGRVVRGGAIALVAGGAISASVGVVTGMQPVAVAGVLGYLAGLGAVAVAAFSPLRHTPLPRRRLVLVAYAAALSQVAVGVGLVGLMLAGLDPVVERWGVLKPAHAWLNVFGFLSVIVAATLVHLAPTVAGTRIVPRRSAVVALAGLMTGAPLIALGLALGDDRIARAGALVELVGAVGLVFHALAVWRDRGRWTTDPDWHRVTGWSLTAAPIWLLVAVTLAAERILSLGAVPASWSLGLIAAPLAVGCVAQALIGAWSHLLPAIGPGDMPAHARQRTILGTAGRARLVALNLGVTLAVLGGSTAWWSSTVVGIGLIGGAVVASLVLFLDAMRGAGRSLGSRTATRSI
jgi:nitrite reductase (NO-forming)